ncbi:MAG: DEAD/DEAH box helicase [Sulfolobales archaeon]|nr:DEAD/DEAH box helicase [Sulfolobales archaeon]MCX8199397.1 DEAD/DEAH box helicase [Sulfolobales archaeon]MDW8170289.1 DEAD/DEAH box helicase [Desulfurococcaceae archaeon]
MSSLEFTVKKWLSREDFEELLRVADYIGYISGEGSKFRLNINKILREGLTKDDVINILDSIEAELEHGDVDRLESILRRETNVKVMWDEVEERILVEIPWSTYSGLKDSLKDLGLSFAGKSKECIKYYIRPHKLMDLKELVVSRGYSIIDLDGLTVEKDLGVKLVFSGELRPYQREALNKWIENKFKGIVALPTGSGKTIVALAALAQASKRTLIVTFTKEQMFQWKDMIARFLNVSGGYVGLFYGEDKTISQITISTYQSAYKNINVLGKYFSLLIVDECHHLPADKFKAIAIGCIAPYRLGLSATVVREDGRHTELFPLMGGVIYHKSASELSSMGYLAKFKVITVKVRPTKDEVGEYVELRKAYKSIVGDRRFDEVLELAKKGDAKAVEALRIHSRMRMLIAFSKSKIEKAVEIVREELEKGSKIIVFTQFVEQAKKLSQELNAGLLIGEMNSDERKRILSDFKASQSSVLVVTTVGDEGLDIPDANVGVIVSGTGSRRQFIQRLGRLLRPKGGDVEARLYEIVVEGTLDEFVARRRKKALDKGLLDDLFANNPEDSI